MDNFVTQLAEIDPTSAPYIIGSYTPYLVAVCVILKAFAISRRPQANPRSAWGLLLVAVGWLVCMAGGQAFKVAPHYLFTFLSLAVIGFVSTIVGIVLAVIGLIECRSNWLRYRQGTTQSVWAFVLSAGLLGLLGIGAAIGLRRAESAQNPAIPVEPISNSLSPVTTATAKRSIPFNELNFTFDAPPPPWVRLDAKATNPAACLAFTKAYPRVGFFVIAERLGLQTTSDSAADFAVRHIREISQESEILEREPQSISGLDGVRLVIHLEARGLHYAYVNWVAASHGYVYQLITYGSQDDEANVRQEAAAMWSRFHQIDPNRQASAPQPGTQLSTKFDSPRFGVSMDLTGLGWHGSPQLTKLLPSALICAENQPSAFFSLQAYQLEDLRPSIEDIARAVCDLHSVSFDDATNVRRITSGQLETCTFDASYYGGGLKFLESVKIVRRPPFVYFLRAWTSDPSQAAIFPDLLDRLHLDDTFSDFADVVPANMNVSHKLLLNSIGVQLENRKQYAESVTYFSKAFDYAPDVTVLNNLLDAADAAGQYTDALVAASRGIKLWPNDPALRAKLAGIQFLLNNPDGAEATYRDLFATKYQDDASFHRYLLLLNKRGKVDAAIAASSAYLANFSSASILVDEALLYDAKGNHDRAEQLLHDKWTSDPSNTVVGVNLAFVMVRGRKYSEAMDLAQQLLAAGNDSSDTYLVLGQAQLGLSHFLQAKEAFETALKKSPGDAIIQTWIDAASARMGQGDNTAIKTQIEPVAIPTSLLNDDPAHPLPAPDTTQDAWYLRRITAISFAPSDHYKISEYRLLKVLTQHGVDTYSNLTFPFDLISDRICLNKLEVRNADGTVVATTDASTCYVTDEEQTQSRSFRKLLNVPVKGLHAGYVLECMVTREEVSPPARMEFQLTLFDSSFPGAFQAVYLTGKPDAVKYVSSPGLTMRKVGDGLCWSMSPMSQHHDEPRQPIEDSFMPYVALGSPEDTWAGVGKEYLDTIAPVMAVDDSVTSLARQLTQGLTTDARKVAVIVKYVQRNYTYVAIEFGRRARTPNKAADVIHNKYGDCKDHALLAMQLLQSASIPADLVLANFDQRIQPGLPSLDQFTHLIVCVPSLMPNGAFDCTAKLSDVQSGVPMDLGNRLVFLLDLANPRLIRLPDYPPAAFAVDCNQTAAMDATGNLSVAETVSLRGADAASFRYYFNSIAPAERSNQMQQFLAGQGAEIELRDLQVDNLDDETQPLVLKYAYSMKNCFVSVSSQMVGSAPALMARYLILPPPTDHRLTPFEYRFPTRLNWTTHIDLPPGYALAAAPQKATVSDPFETGTIQFAQTPTSLTANLSLDSPPFVHPASEYAAFQQDRQKVMGLLEPQIRLAKR